MICFVPDLNGINAFLYLHQPLRMFIIFEYFVRYIRAYVYRGGSSWQKVK